MEENDFKQVGQYIADLARKHQQAIDEKKGLKEGPNEVEVQMANPGPNNMGCVDIQALINTFTNQLTKMSYVQAQLQLENNALKEELNKMYNMFKSSQGPKERA